MYSPGALYQMNEDAAKKARRKSARRKSAPKKAKTPKVNFSVAEIEAWKEVPFPLFGNYQPDGWKLVDTITFYWPFKLDAIKAEFIRQFGQFPGRGYSTGFAGEFAVNVDVWEKE